MSAVPLSADRASADSNDNNDLPSPLHRIISRLPSPISIKRVSTTHTSSPISQKRPKMSNDDVMSSPDIRREILVKQVTKKLSSGVKISLVHNDKDKDLDSDKLDNSVEILTEINDNVSLSLEERNDVKNMHIEQGCLSGGAVMEDKKLGEAELNVAIKPMVEVKTSDPSKSGAKITKEKTIEIQWISVKRNKRKTRVFKFASSVKGGKDEVMIEKAIDNQKVPRVINGRRPYIVVPGVDYDLEEGEGVIMDTEEDEIEIRLARNEKYEMDSFVCDTGYLSEDEMMETPSADKVINKVKQQKRANNIKTKLKFEKMGEPEVIGCLWWSGRGGQKLKMKKWQAITCTSTPIATSFTVPVPKDQGIPVPIPPKPSPTPVQSLPPPPPILSADLDYMSKYHIKYFVKNVVQKAMIRGVGDPYNCSTPMPGNGNKSSDPVVAPSHSALLLQVFEQEDDTLKANKESVNKYVTKYFNKFKYQM